MDVPSLFLVVIIVLPASTPAELHNTPSFAFGQFQNRETTLDIMTIHTYTLHFLEVGWPNGYSFILSFLAPAWSVGQFPSASLHSPLTVFKPDSMSVFTSAKKHETHLVLFLSQ